MTKAWFRAAEIAAAGSPALPSNLDALNRYIARAGWRNDPERSRPIDEAGGGFEYHFSLLPPEAQIRLLGQPKEVQPVAPAAASKAVWAAFDQLPSSARVEAQKRLVAVDRIDMLTLSMTRQGAVAIVAAELDVAPSTLFAWLRSAGSVPRSDRLAALAPRRKGRTATAPCDPRAWSFLVSDYLRPEQPSFEACHRRLLLAAADQGWSPLPSAKTLKRRIEREIPRGAIVMAREGRTAAARLFPHQTRDRSVFSAMEALNADGHRFDVFVRWADGSVGRPVMTAFQDLYSGMIVAHRLDRTENWTVVRHCIADLIESFGIPEHVVFDNGRHFASKWLTGGAPSRYRFKVRDEEPAGILTKLGVTVHFTTPYHGQAKPIERAFRDLCEEIAKHPACAGAYTGNSPVAKPENYASKAVPAEDFERLVAIEIARHNARRGRRAATARGRSFAETFRESFEADGTIVRRATPEQRRLFLLAAEGVTALKPTGEVRLGENRYWAEPLADLAGRKVIVRFDPQDLLAPIAVYAPDGRFVADAPCIAATGFFDIDAAREHARKKRLWLKAQREALDLERRMSVDDLVRMLPEPAAAPREAPKVVRLVAGGRGSPAPEAWDGAEAFGAAVRRLAEGGHVLPFRPNEEGGAV